jgi:D-3-phosphoglycerate dehydrogenase
MVASYGAGYDTMDPACLHRGRVLLVQPGRRQCRGRGEHAVGMMLALLKRMPEATRPCAPAGARPRRADGAGAARAHGGLVGIGHVGTRVAEILPAGLLVPGAGLRSPTWTRRPSRRAAPRRWDAAALAESDVVSLHLPLTARAAT